MKVTFGIPAFNEEQNIGKTITKLKKISDSIIVCDDGSSDMTSEIAEGLGAIVIKHEKNYGYGAAINSIFQKAKEVDTLKSFMDIWSLTHLTCVSWKDLSENPVSFSLCSQSSETYIHMEA